MKVAFFGAGAIGGHLAARLAAAGVDVSVVARGPHLQAIQTDGLRLQMPDAEIHVRVRASASAEALGPHDLVVSTVKAHGLPDAVDGLRALSAPDAPIVYAVNGLPWWYFHRHEGALAERRLPRLDPGGRLWDVLGADRAIGCVVQSPNEVIAPGVIRNGTVNNVFTLGEPDGTVSSRLTRVLATLQHGVPEARASRTIRTDIWRKLLLNLSLSPLACLTLSTGREVSADPALREVFARLVSEGEHVAKALGVDPAPDIPAMLDRMAGVRHRSSMLQDLAGGRPLEIDGQLTVVADVARWLGVATPTLDVVLALLVRRAAQDGLYPGATAED